MSDVTITLSRAQAIELASLLWECCAETDEGVKTLREELPLSETWRIVCTAIAPASFIPDDQD
jgi:hypothetical protein